MHRFEEEGIYCVISEGAPDTYCLVNVMLRPEKTDTPKLVNQEPFVLFKYHKVHLSCSTENSYIHYTTDGSTPTKLSMVSFYLFFYYFYFE